jgi:MFS family permease
LKTLIADTATNTVGYPDVAGQTDLFRAGSLRYRLQHSPAWLFVVYVSFSSFVVYSCMYGFRKPYTAASFDGISFFGISYKVVLVISQVLGYMLSKFYGIRFIATMQPSRRAGFIVKLIGVAWGSLLLFALVPAPYNFIFMFINGLPLGMVWGLVFGFLEGRRVTELMGAILATSFIFASGLAKTAGKWLMLSAGVSEWWMPFAAGALFLGPLLLSTWLLDQTPPPTPLDIAQRTVRRPMERQERKAFLKTFAFALAPVVTAYVMLTILRDFTEDFANELWTETGYRNSADIFARTSTVTSLIVLAVIAGFFLIRDNYKAFRMNHVIIIAGFILAAGATFLFHLHMISPVVWVVGASTGLYLGYVPYNCFYFERMLAAFKIEGNVGFLIYIADAFGYLGTVVVLLVKEFVQIKVSWVNFFTGMFYTAAAAGVIFVIWSSVLYARIYRKRGKEYAG